MADGLPRSHDVIPELLLGKKGHVAANGFLQIRQVTDVAAPKDADLGVEGRYVGAARPAVTVKAGQLERPISLAAAGVAQKIVRRALVPPCLTG